MSSSNSIRLVLVLAVVVAALGVFIADLSASDQAKGVNLDSVQHSVSFDTQLNQAKAKIDEIALQGLLTSPSFDTQLNAAKRKIDEIARQGQKSR